MPSVGNIKITDMKRLSNKLKPDQEFTADEAKDILNYKGTVKELSQKIMHCVYFEIARTEIEYYRYGGSRSFTVYRKKERLTI